MTNKEKIRKETEKCYSDALERAKIFNTDYWEGKADAYRNVLLQFDSLQEESASEDLEVEFVLYLKRKFNIPQEGNVLKTNGWKPSPYDILDIAKHFAKWQKKQTIDKACEWLEEHLIDFWSQRITNTDYFIEDFKQAMNN